jgi:hypothetical protein
MVVRVGTRDREATTEPETVTPTGDISLLVIKSESEYECEYFPVICFLFQPSGGHHLSVLGAHLHFWCRNDDVSAAKVIWTRY